jgi:hypothetical protein
MEAPIAGNKKPPPMRMAVIFPTVFKWTTEGDNYLQKISTVLKINGVSRLANWWKSKSRSFDSPPPN